MTGPLLPRSTRGITRIAVALLPVAVLFFAVLFFAGSGCQRTTWLLVDQDADPAGHGGHPGAVFRIHPQKHTVEVFATSRLWHDPTDILQDPDGSFLVLDYHEGGAGGIYRVSSDGRRVEALGIPPGLVDPTRFLRHQDGSIWIVDKNADPRELGKKADQSTGTIWRLAPDRKKLEVLFTGPPLQAPADLCFVGEVPYVLDADAFRTRLFEPEGAIFKLVISGSEPAKLETVMRPTRMVSPFSMKPWSQGRFLITDVNSGPQDWDPEQRQKKGASYRGSVFLVDPATNAMTWHQHPEFRDPAGGTVVKTRDGLRLVLADASADPDRLGKEATKRGFSGDGRGAVFEIDPETGASRVLCTSKLFVNPVRIEAFRQ